MSATTGERIWRVLQFCLHSVQAILKFLTLCVHRGLSVIQCVTGHGQWVPKDLAAWSTRSCVFSSFQRVAFNKTLRFARFFMFSAPIPASALWVIMTSRVAISPRQWLSCQVFVCFGPETDEMKTKNRPTHRAMLLATLRARPWCRWRSLISEVFQRHNSRLTVAKR